ncbi:MAG TPA: tRNA (adenosine(37)-N6)-dimethylallyltransferase MiaA [bacterium]|nr:tRNA (adenosine(37)-N6)-dimethylallyltransferase MiaA [bacterium]
MSAPALIVIGGPTAIGKTAIAVALAERLDAEIVSADSRTLYRGMDIGTAKPTPEDRRRVPHHLIDVAAPDEIVTLADYQRLARVALEGIRGRHRVALLVGGTGLYIRAVVDDLRIPSAPPNWPLRAELEAEEHAGGPGTLYRRLLLVDPAAAMRVHPHNVRRIIRALEVHAGTGVPISMLQQALLPATVDRAPVPGVAMFALTMDGSLLQARIRRRIDQHLAAGLVEEVRSLLRTGFSRTLPALQGLGYKEIAAHLDGSVSLEEAGEILRRNTRRYAKRQSTWFRADRRYRWLDVGEAPPEAVAEQIRVMITM